ncbi:DUF1826 domain-containing protein [Pseudaestuariivita sp.]|uniref:DUF1826 domain-containing protein n=1 Tax=Pseudaestuariivita sp. TaxID=2211669 RepID=UPI0040589260
MPADVLGWLDALAPEHLPHGRMVASVAGIARAAEALCDAARMPAMPERAWLIGDIASLAERFADMMEARQLRLRLEAVTTNACRKFHRDAITARLVCTYRGTGTQYGTAHAGGDPQEILTVPTGAPILMRGSLWRPEPDAGLLHRSPPIEGSGETRLLLVLDPLSGDDATFDHAP